MWFPYGEREVKEKRRKKDTSLILDLFSSFFFLSSLCSLQSRCDERVAMKLKFMVDECEY